MMGNGSDTIRIILNGQQILPDGTIMTRPNEEKPPRIFRILRSAFRDRELKLGLNASLLKDLSEALGTDEVVLEIGKADSAILVKPIRGEDGTVGLIMPIRLNGKGA